MEFDKRALGEFTVTGDKLRVSDPCYKKGTWCAGVVENVKPGTWQAATWIHDEGSWGMRVAELHVWHQDHISEADHANELLNIDVGVDSGQAGIFDEALYPEDPGNYEEGTWYKKACDQTYDDKKNQRTQNSGGIVEGMGAVSSSGFGDGSYRAFVDRDVSGKVVAVRIVYISDEEDEEDYEDDYDGQPDEAQEWHDFDPDC